MGDSYSADELPLDDPPVLHDPPGKVTNLKAGQRGIFRGPYTDGFENYSEILNRAPKLR